MKNRKNIYIVVCKNDQPYIGVGGKVGKPDKDGEIIMETYTKFASLANAKKNFERFKRLGKCRIARLEFVTDYEEENAK